MGFVGEDAACGGEEEEEGEWVEIHSESCGEFRGELCGGFCYLWFGLSFDGPGVEVLVWFWWAGSGGRGMVNEKGNWLGR